jgi:RNA polymerase sigma-70 factor (ECF subfamily)
MEEQRAIHLLKQGDLQGLDFLVKRYYYRAVKSAYLILQDHAEAENIVQNAFLHAYENINQLASARFGPWFLRSVVNASLKAAQRQKKHTSLDAEVEGQSLADLLADQKPMPESEVEMDELVQAVRGALARLPAEQRAALVMKYYLELSEAEMVTKLDRPLSTVKWRLYTARQRLKNILQPYFSKADDLQSTDTSQHQE